MAQYLTETFAESNIAGLESWLRKNGFETMRIDPFSPRKTLRERIREESRPNEAVKFYPVKEAGKPTTIKVTIKRI